ncbi:5608_t:CDS:2 [Entrophospora sp. SA101]|nr:5608_t:CDS:2 [Entrophospora sp. SA101]CAJ0916301.1 4171_t:CDS:2 [Entrophospora sp. SA101]
MARQNFVGIVIGTAMRKTVKVNVARQATHPIVRKIITKHKKFFAHDEEEKCKLGDVVRIEACRRLSKNKSFTVSEIIR